GSGPSKLTPDANGWVALTKSKAKVSKPIKPTPTNENRFDILEKAPREVVAEIQDANEIPDDWEAAFAESGSASSESETSDVSSPATAEDI
ncbi:hypothetical protein SARC_16298, partial [Sphaeroforma arctica JP610]